jgi:hypothetical protein
MVEVIAVAAIVEKATAKLHLQARQNQAFQSRGTANGKQHITTATTHKVRNATHMARLHVVRTQKMTSKNRTHASQLENPAVRVQAM